MIPSNSNDSSPRRRRIQAILADNPELTYEEATQI
jgi:hypothetical protein